MLPPITCNTASVLARTKVVESVFWMGIDTCALSENSGCSVYRLEERAEKVRKKSNVSVHIMLRPR